MSHNHHHHDHSQIQNRKTLFIAFFLTFCFAVFEVISSLFFHTLALFSEGIHMLSDGFSLGLGFLASIIGMKMATISFPFGYRRFETIVAFINGLTLLLIPVYVVYESIMRFYHPKDVMSKQMLMVAVIGLIINLIVAIVLFKGNHDNNLNIKAASLHVLSDLLSSVAAIIASLCILFWNWHFIDPLVSLLVSIVIFFGGLRITKDSFHILMEGSPTMMKHSDILKAILTVNGVVSVNQMKIWSLTSNFHHGIFHLTVDKKSDAEEILHTLQHLLLDFDIHPTIQFNFQN